MSACKAAECCTLRLLHVFPTVLETVYSYCSSYQQCVTKGGFGWPFRCLKEVSFFWGYGRAQEYYCRTKFKLPLRKHTLRRGDTTHHLLEPSQNIYLRVRRSADLPHVLPHTTLTRAT